MSLLLAACGLLGGGSGALADGSGARFEGTTMGTLYAVTVPELPPGTDRAALGRSLEGILDGVDRRMSTWREDSELSRFNRSRSTDWFPVSEDTRRVVAEALHISALSDGAFDVTVAPLVDLWGFGPGPRTPRVPAPARVARALREVGWRHLQARPAPPALRKSRPGLRIDLSAIAKGYAVDLLARRLEAAGARRYLVEVGGELRVRGHDAAGRPWRVGVQSPAGGVQRVLSLSRGAVATSGDYRSFFERNGHRYSHTIDPRTGSPVPRPPASVTVLAARAVRADALATALMVLGPRAGADLARRAGVAAMFLLRTGHGLEERFVGGFERHLRAPP